MSNVRIYGVFSHMISRCENKNDKDYCNYGARGIRVSTAWRHSFDTFLQDMGPRPQGCSIERLNNDGHYEVGNCIWADRKKQNRNKRNNRLLSGNGVTKTLAEWSETTGRSVQTIHSRLRRGWSHDQALFSASVRRSDQAEQHSFDGKTMSLKQWSEHLGYNYDALKARRKYGWSIERILTTPVMSEVELELNGVVLTRKQWAERTGIKAKTIAKRLSDGWCVADALTCRTHPS